MIDLWRPIDTAPETPGEPVIVFAPYKDGVEPGAFPGTVGEALRGLDGYWYWAGAIPGHIDPIGEEGHGDPTHWMPLPDPPALDIEDEPDD